MKGLVLTVFKLQYVLYMLEVKIILNGLII